MLTDKGNFSNPFVDKYEILCKIGQGTYGLVRKARNKQTGQMVAIKTITMPKLNDPLAFPVTALREVTILQKLKHENIVKLIEMTRTVPSTSQHLMSKMFMVLEFCEHDLVGLLSNSNVVFRLEHIKMVIKQLLTGIFFMHLHKIMHRDVKPANILITRSGVVKLADFGMARALKPTPGPTSKPQPEICYTTGVVTMWYRPPEVLLGQKDYGLPVDLWSVGCVLAEMFTKAPIMKGDSQLKQLHLISKLCGSITTETWPDVRRLQLFRLLRLPRTDTRKIWERMKPHMDCDVGLDLLDRLLTLDPSKRIDSDGALDHMFFWSNPMPLDLAEMMSTYTRSMFAHFVRPQATAAARPNPGQAPPRPAQPTSPGYHDRIY